MPRPYILPTNSTTDLEIAVERLLIEIETTYYDGTDGITECDWDDIVALVKKVRWQQRLERIKP